MAQWAKSGQFAPKNKQKREAPWSSGECLWSLDMGSNPGFIYKQLDGKMDHLMAKKKGKPHQKKFFYLKKNLFLFVRNNLSIKYD
jgi:hypothetical protein